MCETTCIVHRCRGRGGFIFPSDAALKANWLKAIKWGIPLEPKKTAVVCPAHFARDDFDINLVDGQERKSLKDGAVPSIFPWNSDLWENQESSSEPSEDDEGSSNPSSSDSDGGDVSDVSDGEREYEEVSTAGKLFTSPKASRIQEGTTTTSGAANGRGINNDSSSANSTKSNDLTSSGSCTPSSGRISKQDEPASKSIPGLESSTMSHNQKSGTATLGEKSERFSSDQKLIEEFDVNPCPSRMRQDELRLNLGLQNRSRLQNWFRNRRTQYRKAALEMTDDSYETLEPANKDVSDHEDEGRPVVPTSSESDTETQLRLQKLWMYYGTQGCDVPRGPVLKEIAAECGLSEDATKNWFEYAKRRSAKNKKSNTNKLLLKKFIQNCYPSREEVESMSCSTGMSPAEIHNWFRTERYWQTMYFNDEEDKKTPLEGNSSQMPQTESKSQRETPRSPASQVSDASRSEGHASCNYKTQSANDTDRESVSTLGEDAPEIDLTREMEGESPQPKPSSPLWSGSSSSVDLSNQPSLNNRAILQGWMGRLLNSKRYGHTAPISEDEDDNGDLTADSTKARNKLDKSPQKDKTEDAAHSSSSDCEIIEPELPMIEIDSDEEPPSKPQTGARTDEAKQPAKTSAPPRAQITGKGEMVVYLPDSSGSLETEQLSRLLKRLGPLKAGTVIKTAGKQIYRVVAAKHSLDSTDPPRIVLTKIKEPTSKKADDTRKTAAKASKSVEVVTARKNQAENSDSSSKNVIVAPPSKRRRNDSGQERSGSLALPKTGVIRRVRAGCGKSKESLNSPGQKRVLLKRKLEEKPKLEPQSYITIGEHHDAEVVGSAAKQVTYVGGGMQRIVRNKVERVSGTRPRTAVVEEKMDTLETANDETEANPKCAQAGIICRRPTTNVTVVQPDKSQSTATVMAAPTGGKPPLNAQSPKFLISGVVQAQNGQMIAIVQANVRTDGKLNTPPIHQNQQILKQAHQPIKIGQKQSVPGVIRTLPASVAKPSGEENLSTYPNLVPEVDNLKSGSKATVKLKTVYGVESHCYFLDSKLSKVDFTDRPLQKYKTKFLPELQHGLIYWGHCPAAKRLFQLQKVIIGTIMSAQKPEPRHFSAVKLLTLPSMYVLQCLVHVHKNFKAVHKRIWQWTANKTQGRTTPNVLNYEANGFKLYKALPPEMHQMSTDMFIAVMKVFLHKYPLFSLKAYFEVVGKLGSNATQNAKPAPTQEETDTLLS